MRIKLHSLYNFLLSYLNEKRLVMSIPYVDTGSYAKERS